ncbi:MAG: HepT-like ribonuclease domain-containing protein [bacterium]
MQHEERDAAYLWDMLDAAKTIVQFTKNVKFNQYMQDRKSQLAIEREIEIIGEAARRISDHFKDAHTEIPWRSIIAQRNVIAHEYGEIKQDRIWNVAVTKIPELIAIIEPLLPSLPPEKEEEEKE